MAGDERCRSALRHSAFIPGRSAGGLSSAPSCSRLTAQSRRPRSCALPLLTRSQFTGSLRRSRWCMSWRGIRTPFQRVRSSLLLVSAERTSALQGAPPNRRDLGLPPRKGEERPRRGASGDTGTCGRGPASTPIPSSWRTGSSAGDGEHAYAFMCDATARIEARVQVTADGIKSYIRAVPGAFKGDVDFAQLVSPLDTIGRYSAPSF